MKVFLLISVILSVTFVVKSESPIEVERECRQDQEYYECGSGDDNAGCCNYLKTKDSGDKCVSGCRCKEGLYANSMGQCLTKDQCLGNCPNKNEEFREGISSTCGFPSCVKNPMAQIAACSKDLRSGCACINQTLRYDGKCITAEECLKIQKS